MNEILRSDSFLGANVTIPYKEEIIQYLDEVDSPAETVSAVNTIVKGSDGKLVGYNTDAPALFQVLRECGVADLERAFVFGTGGGARSSLLSLHQLGCTKFTIGYRSTKRQSAVEKLLRTLAVKATFVPIAEIHQFFIWADENRVFTDKESRAHLQIDEDLLRSWNCGAQSEKVKNDELKHFDLLVNATPVGLFPKSDETIEDHPMFLRMFRVVTDLVYNPEETKLLYSAKLAGCKTISGVKMFHRQAKLSRDIWLKELN